ncbi:hypothetical protein [Nocardiopsis suaedae]|uniref:Uncharacterized protein n=1 Tax=Nocardiopsis suaedae TaxID=3018444 RepID=A0ABT4TIQ1_9ACTN|nr:hypothetical protein [Nocardiopsis suaedae]MDA2804551.1 hypothetical protein [Nocardiopsis suaedae]
MTRRLPAFALELGQRVLIDGHPAQVIGTRPHPDRDQAARGRLQLCLVRWSGHAYWVDYLTVNAADPIALDGDTV